MDFLKPGFGSTFTIFLIVSSFWKDRKKEKVRIRKRGIVSKLERYKDIKDR